MSGSRTARVWFRKYQEDRCSLLAAAIAYRALFSIIPLTALLVAGASQVLRFPEIRRQVVDSIIERMPIGRGLVVDALQSIRDSSEPLTFLGILFLLWAGMGMLGTVRETLNIAWGVRPMNFVMQRVVEIVGVLGLGVLVIVSVSGTAILHTIRNFGVAWLGDPDPDHSWVLEPATAVLTAGVTFVAFVLVYRYVPHVRHGIRDVVPGALLGTVLFETGKHGFAFYISTFSNHEVHGALGTVMLFLLWVYVSANILLAGAELNAVRHGVVPPSMRRCEDPAVAQRAKQVEDPDADVIADVHEEAKEAKEQGRRSSPGGQ